MYYLTSACVFRNVYYLFRLHLFYDYCCILMINKPIMKSKVTAGQLISPLREHYLQPLFLVIPRTTDCL